MKRRTLAGLLASLLILILVVVLLIYHNSYSIALSKAGLSKDSIDYIDTGIDDNGNEYRVVFQYMPENMVKILRLTKNDRGVWKVAEEAYGPDSEVPYVTTGWMRVASVGRYEVDDQTHIEFEVHKVYGGNNAIKQIEIPMELLPSNVSVNIFQAGTVYVLHFVTYGSAETLNQINISHLLEQTDCIQR